MRIVSIAIVSTLSAVWTGVANEPLCAEDVQRSFSLETIDANPPARPYSKMAGDIDKDGDLDIVIGGAKGPMVWYANPSWKQTHIADGGWDCVKGDVADIDGDGDADVVMGGVVWLSNPRVGGGTWIMTRIDNQRAHDVEAADVNRDGRLDIVARDQSAFGKAGNAIYVYTQETPSQWKKRVIQCPHGEGLKLGDIDADGDHDILTGGRWYENSAAAWKEHIFSQAWTEPDAKVQMADINGDGRRDIVLAPAELKGEEYKVAWYEAPEEPRTAGWTEHVIVPSIECVVHSLGVGDLDNDGDVDVAIAEMHQGTDPDEVSVLLNYDKGKVWRKQVLASTGSHDIVVVDIDQDGDLDIFGANHAGVHPLELWRNRQK